MKLLQDLAAYLPRLRHADVHKFCVFFDRYRAHLPSMSESLYEHLDEADQRRFVIWLLKRWARLDFVNPVEAGLYVQKIQDVKREARRPVALNGATYLERDFRSQGYPFTLLGYDWFLGVHDVFYNQYEHQDTTLSPGDVIIDAGAFIGDTAVLFHHKLGGRCQIHSFELLDENLALLVHNLESNGVKPGEVMINKLALADVTGREIVIDRGNAQGSTSIFGADAAGDRVTTITLDDYVLLKNLTRVDYIKMDIEGAEIPALEGARQTIQHFRPKLAICLYHKWDDAITIPQFIRSTGVEYTFSFKWVQLTGGREAVLLASPVTASTRTRATRADASSSPADHLPAALAALTTAYLKKHDQADALWRERQLSKRTSAAPALTSA